MLARMSLTSASSSTIPFRLIEASFRALTRFSGAAVNVSFWSEVLAALTSAILKKEIPEL